MLQYTYPGRLSTSHENPLTMQSTYS